MVDPGSEGLAYALIHRRAPKILTEAHSQVSQTDTGQ
jgi:hypothetical protein